MGVQARDGVADDRLDEGNSDGWEGAGDIDARVFQVENAQESVNDRGEDSGDTFDWDTGHTVQNGVLAVVGIDPIAYIFASASGSAVLGFAEPEILYHAGTELIVENVRPLLTSQTYPPSVSPIGDNERGAGQSAGVREEVAVQDADEGKQ